MLATIGSPRQASLNKHLKSLLPDKVYKRKKVKYLARIVKGFEDLAEAKAFFSQLVEINAYAHLTRPIPKQEGKEEWAELLDANYGIHENIWS